MLNTLNWYWFGKMIETIRKRFTEDKGTKGKDEKEEGVLIEGLIDSSTLMTDIVEEESDEVKTEDKGKMEKSEANGSSMIELEKTEVRRRRD